MTARAALASQAIRRALVRAPNIHAESLNSSARALGPALYHRHHHHPHSRVSVLNQRPFLSRSFSSSTSSSHAMAAPTEPAATSESTTPDSITPDFLTSKLQSSLNITHINIEDMSGGCGQAFNAIIVSPDFDKKNLLARSRMVNGVLKEEIRAIHAWTPRCLTPEQWEKEKERIG